MPLGLFLALAGGLVAPLLRSRDGQISDGTPVLGPPDLRVLAEISDQNHLVHATRHRRSPDLLDLPDFAFACAGLQLVGDPITHRAPLPEPKGAPFPVIHI